MRTQRTLAGDRAVFVRGASLIPARRGALAPSAFFKRAAPVKEAPPAPQKKSGGLFGFGGASKKAAPKEPAAQPQRKVPFGLGGSGGQKQTKKSAPVPSKADEYARRQGVGGRLLGAFDFAEVRSKEDAELLYDAKYGKLEGGRLTVEQAAALRRKVGGTARDFWKTSIDVEGEYTDKGYVDEGAAAVPALPLLVGVVLALFGTVAYVVAQTS